MRHKVNYENTIFKKQKQFERFLNNFSVTSINLEKSLKYLRLLMNHKGVHTKSKIQSLLKSNLYSQSQKLFKSSL